MFTTASTDEKCQHCLKLGAEAAINYQEQDFVTAIQELTDGRGVDVILDMVGVIMYRKTSLLLHFEAGLYPSPSLEAQKQTWT